MGIFTASLTLSLSLPFPLSGDGAYDVRSSRVVAGVLTAEDDVHDAPDPIDLVAVLAVGALPEQDKGK